jgi:hypothetical protein
MNWILLVFTLFIVGCGGKDQKLQFKVTSTNSVADKMASPSSSLDNEIASVTGVQAFSESIAPTVKSFGCAKCHSAIQAPYFAHSDVHQAYRSFQLAYLIDGKNPEKSRFITRLQEGHNCPTSFGCSKAEELMLTSIKDYLAKIEIKNSSSEEAKLLMTDKSFYREAIGQESVKIPAMVEGESLQRLGRGHISLSPQANSGVTATFPAVPPNPHDDSRKGVVLSGCSSEGDQNFQIQEYPRYPDQNGFVPYALGVYMTLFDPRADRLAIKNQIVNGSHSALAGFLLKASPTSFFHTSSSPTTQLVVFPPADRYPFGVSVDQAQAVASTGSYEWFSPDEKDLFFQIQHKQMVQFLNAQKNSYDYRRNLFLYQVLTTFRGYFFIKPFQADETLLEARSANKIIWDLVGGSSGEAGFQKLLDIYGIKGLVSKIAGNFIFDEAAITRALTPDINGVTPLDLVGLFSTTSKRSPRGGDYFQSTFPSTVDGFRQTVAASRQFSIKFPSTANAIDLSQLKVSSLSDITYNEKLKIQFKDNIHLFLAGPSQTMRCVECHSSDSLTDEERPTFASQNVDQSFASFKDFSLIDWNQGGNHKIVKWLSEGHGGALDVCGGSLASCQQIASQLNTRIEKFLDEKDFLDQQKNNSQVSFISLGENERKPGRLHFNFELTKSEKIYPVVRLRTIYPESDIEKKRDYLRFRLIDVKNQKVVPLALNKAESCGRLEGKYLGEFSWVDFSVNNNELSPWDLLPAGTYRLELVEAQSGLDIDLLFVTNNNSENPKSDSSLLYLSLEQAQRTLTFDLSKIVGAQAKLFINVQEYDDYFLFSNPRIEASKGLMIQGFIPVINNEFKFKDASYRHLAFFHQDELKIAKIPPMLVLRENQSLAETSFAFAFDILKIYSGATPPSLVDQRSHQRAMCQRLDLFRNLIKPILQWPALASTFSQNALKSRYDPNLSINIASNTYHFEMHWNWGAANVMHGFSRKGDAINMQQNQCLNCHTENHKTFPMKKFWGSDEELCAEFLARVNWNDLADSEILKGIVQFDNHPGLVFPGTPVKLGSDDYQKDPNGPLGLKRVLQGGFYIYTQAEINAGFQTLVTRRGLKAQGTTAEMKEYNDWKAYLQKFVGTYKFFIWDRLNTPLLPKWHLGIVFEEDEPCLNLYRQKKYADADTCLTQVTKGRRLTVPADPWLQVSRKNNPHDFYRAFQAYLTDSSGREIASTYGNYGILHLEEENRTTDASGNKQFKFSHQAGRDFFKAQILYWLGEEKKQR